MPPTEPRLGVVFTAWFGFNGATGGMTGGLGSTHWNDGPDTAGIVHTPYQVAGAIGSALPAWGGPSFYCSADPLVVSYQIEKMRETGITVLLYSWWGWGDTNLDGVVTGHPDQWINSSLTEMLTQLKGSGSDIQVAVLIEPFPKTQASIEPNTLTNPQMQRVLDYLYKNFYQKFPDQMMTWDDNIVGEHPLLSTFDPMQIVDAGMVNPTTTGVIASNNAIDWRPKTDVATIELINPGPGGSLAVAVVSSIRVQVTLATDGGGVITSTASDVIAAVNADATAAAVLGAEVVVGSDGTGLVAVVAETSLTAITALAADVAIGATTVVVNDETAFSVGTHVQLTGLTEGAPETVTIKTLDGGGGPTYTWTLENATRLAHLSTEVAKKSDFRWTHKRLSSQDRSSASEAQGWEWWLVPQQALSVTISDADGVLFPNHRFSEYYLHLAQASYLQAYQWRDIEQTFQNSVYEGQWQWMVDNKSKVGLIIVYSWNFYGELAQLEPSTGGPAPPEEDYIQKTRRYYEALLAGQNIEPYSRAWSTVSQLKAMIQPIDFATLDFSTQDELDLYLKDLLRRAQDHTEGYLRRTYTPQVVPIAVQDVQLRLAANLYHQTLKNRRGPLQQVGEFEVKLIDDSVFTPGLKSDLGPYTDKRVLGVL